MTIETKFNINDLVQHKFQKTYKDNIYVVALEVIEIQCVLCYTTAQIFYICRTIHASVDTKRDKDYKPVVRIVDFHPGRNKEGEYVKLREDELKPCEHELVLELKA